MARVIDEFPPSTRQSKYDWDKWADGRIWELEAGKDFNQKVESMRQAASKIAKARKLDLRTAKVSRDSKVYLVLQFQKGASARARKTSKS